MSRSLSRRTFLAASAAPILTHCGFKPCPPQAPASPLPSCQAGYRFQNWAKTISCRPASFCQPGSVDEVSALVRQAAAAGQEVRTFGAGHSFSPLVLTNDVLVNLDRMQSVVSVDKERKRVTVQAGIRLKQLIPALRREQLALANTGSVTEQSIVGATATGTHGTGVTLPIIARSIVGLKLVSGNGEVVTIGEDDERLRAARVSLGALGIVTEVTLQCVDDYELELNAYWCQLDDVVANLDQIVAENLRVRIWWLVWELGCRDSVIVTTMNRPGASGGFLERFGAKKAGQADPLPMETRKLLEQRPKTAEPSCSHMQRRSGPYDQILTVPLLEVLHRECEYAIPVARTAEALRECRKFFADFDAKLLMPVEVRFVGKDDSLLSPALDRDSGFIGVSVREGENGMEIFGRFEPLMRGLGGRPHWGKYFNLNAGQVKELYPDTYDRFVAIRKDLDPRGVFANYQVKQLFG